MFSRNPLLSVSCGNPRSKPPPPPHAFGIPIVSIPPCLWICSSKNPPCPRKKAVRGMVWIFSGVTHFYSILNSSVRKNKGSGYWISNACNGALCVSGAREERVEENNVLVTRDITCFLCCDFVPRQHIMLNVTSNFVLSGIWRSPVLCRNKAMLICSYK